MADAPKLTGTSRRPTSTEYSDRVTNDPILLFRRREQGWCGVAPRDSLSRLLQTLTINRTLPDRRGGCLPTEGVFEGEEGEKSKEEKMTGSRSSRQSDTYAGKCSSLLRTIYYTRAL